MNGNFKPPKPSLYNPIWRPMSCHQTQHYVFFSLPLLPRLFLFFFLLLLQDFTKHLLLPFRRCCSRLVRRFLRHFNHCKIIYMAHGSKEMSDHIPAHQRLPPEIKDEIISYLDPVSKVSLKKTCQRFWQTVLLRKEGMAERDRSLIWFQLQRDYLNSLEYQNLCLSTELRSQSRRGAVYLGRLHTHLHSETETRYLNHDNSMSILCRDTLGLATDIEKLRQQRFYLLFLLNELNRLASVFEEDSSFLTADAKELYGDQLRQWSPMTLSVNTYSISDSQQVKRPNIRSRLRSFNTRDILRYLVEKSPPFLFGCIMMLLCATKYIEMNYPRHIKRQASSHLDNVIPPTPPVTLDGRKQNTYFSFFLG